MSDSDRCKDCGSFVGVDGECNGKRVWYTMARTFCDKVRLMRAKGKG